MCADADEERGTPESDGVSKVGERKSRRQTQSTHAVRRPLQTRGEVLVGGIGRGQGRGKSPWLGELSQKLKIGMIFLAGWLHSYELKGSHQADRLKHIAYCDLLRHSRAGAWCPTTFSRAILVRAMTTPTLTLIPYCNTYLDFVRLEHALLYCM